MKTGLSGTWGVGPPGEMLWEGPVLGLDVTVVTQIYAQDTTA